MLLDVLLPFSTTVLVAIGTISASVVYLWWSRRARTSLPPFPVTPLPVVGNLLNLDSNLQKTFEKWRQQCGNVYSIYMGRTLVILVNRYEAVREALLTYGDYFSDRPTIFLDQVIDSINCGLMTASGDVWKEQRSVSVSILRQLGMGKNVLAEKIEEEVGHYLKLIEDKMDGPVDLENATPIALANIICSIMVSERHQYNDPKFKILTDNLAWVVKHIKATNPLNFIPQLIFLPGDLFEGKELRSRLFESIELFADHYIKENEADETRENFITLYLRQSRLNKEQGKATFLDKKNLARCILDIFGAATDTTSKTILWFILYLLHNPVVQGKLHKEIDTQIGVGKIPNLSDRSLLPYLNATIMETQRLASVLPLAITHLCSETVKFRGYTIPKGAYIAPNLDSVLFDEDVWGKDAQDFRPERHLDEAGKLVIRPEFIPFSIGNRFCPGDALAKMELFLFTSAMIQRFTFLPEDENNLPSIEGIYGFARSPHPFKFRVVRR